MSDKRDSAEPMRHAPVSEQPALMALWHPTRNTADPIALTTGSTRKVWWKCPEGPDHEWEASLQSVAKSVAAGHRGCPFCRGLRASVTNSVRTMMPKSAAQWHPSRNGDLTPDDLSWGSNRPVWWKCPEGPDHEWRANPWARRKRADGTCPFCVNRRVSVTNMLSLNAPDTAAQWHPSRNGDLTPDQVVLSTQRRVWWLCPNGSDHEWEAPVHWRTMMGYGCPFCSGRRVSATNSVRALIPTAVPMWHPHRNGDLTPDDVLAGTSDLIWWKCPEGPDHEWECAPLILRRSVNARTKGCPFCAGMRPSVTNHLANHPRLAAEVHPTRNGDLTSEQIPAGSAQKIWWRCSTNPEHEWHASVVNRLRGRNCPFCKPSLRSAWETCIAYELQTLFDGIDLTEDKIIDAGKPLHVDIIIPSLQVAIEVDGRYHHADRQDRDQRKSAQVRAAGWRHLRIREEPLDAINDEDVLLPPDTAVKPTVDALLRRLLELGWAHGHESTIDTYFSEPEARRLDEALADVSKTRDGRKVRTPGHPKGPNRDARWETAFAHLAAYTAREGHASPTFDTREDGYPLGAWVSFQRKRHREGALQPDRAARLAGLAGWSFDPLAEVFDHHFTLYANYVNRRGHAYIEVGHRENNVNLGEWVRSLQRTRTRLADDQRARLEALPGWTWDRTTWSRHRYSEDPTDPTLF